MRAGAERLPVLGENRPREERLLISLCQQESQKRAILWKPCLHSILAAMVCYVAIHFLSTKNLFIHILSTHYYKK